MMRFRLRFLSYGLYNAKLEFFSHFDESHETTVRNKFSLHHDPSTGIKANYFSEP
jgi:hypothetical protein